MPIHLATCPPCCGLTLCMSSMQTWPMFEPPVQHATNKRGSAQGMPYSATNACGGRRPPLNWQCSIPQDAPSARGDLAEPTSGCCRMLEVAEAKTALQHLKRVAKHRRAQVEKQAAHIDEVKRDLQASRWAPFYFAWLCIDT